MPVPGKKILAEEFDTFFEDDEEDEEAYSEVKRTSSACPRQKNGLEQTLEIFWS